MNYSLLIIFVGAAAISFTCVPIIRDIVKHNKTSKAHLLINLVCISIATVIFAIWIAPPLGVAIYLYILFLALGMFMFVKLMHSLYHRPKNPLKKNGRL